MRPELKIFFFLLLLICSIVLIKYILFKKEFSFYQNDYLREYYKYSDDKGWNNANVVPFKNIQRYSQSNRLSLELKLKNLGGNIVGFIPLGFILPLLFPNFKKFIFLIGFIFWLSLTFELLQLIFNLGYFDIDDIILNTSGGAIGYFMYWLTKKYFEEPKPKVSFYK